MQVHFLEMLRNLLALSAGGVIGIVFGRIQNAALKRNQKLQNTGALNNGWAVMPGSMRRVAYLLVLLVLIQILCPLLFVNGSEWWVSAGVVFGYGGALLYRLKRA
jgi:hypothetical protein